MSPTQALKQTLTSFVRTFVFPRHLVVPFAQLGTLEARIERMWLDADAGPVEGWLLLGDGVSADRPGPLVLFAHGNGELIDYWPESLGMYLGMGVSLFLPEYRGYGRSAGEPSEPALVYDLEAWLERLTRRPEVDATRLIYHGRSIGGGVVCALAAVRPPHAMVLQSTFTCIADVARRFGVPRAFITEPFDNLTVIRQARFPCLIMHGKRDRLIPFAHAERLCAACAQAEISAYDADHNSPFEPLRYWREIRSFLMRHHLIER